MVARKGKEIKTRAYIANLIRLEGNEFILDYNICGNGCNQASANEHEPNCNNCHYKQWHVTFSFTRNLIRPAITDAHLVAKVAMLDF